MLSAYHHGLCRTEMAAHRVRGTARLNLTWLILKPSFCFVFTAFSDNPMPDSEAEKKKVSSSCNGLLGLITSNQTPQSPPPTDPHPWLTRPATNWPGQSAVAGLEFHLKFSHTIVTLKLNQISDIPAKSHRKTSLLDVTGVPQSVVV